MLTLLIALMLGQHTHGEFTPLKACIGTTSPVIRSAFADGFDVTVKWTIYTTKPIASVRLMSAPSANPGEIPKGHRVVRHWTFPTTVAAYVRDFTGASFRAEDQLRTWVRVVVDEVGGCSTVSDLREVSRK